MRKALSLIILVFTALAMRAQENLPAVDKSPLDVAYYPTNTAFRNFQKGAERDIQPKARILYSRPQKKGRSIFGELVPYGEIWRLGANEATELTLYTDAMLGDVALKAGTYSLFALVEEDSWTFLVSTDLYIWGQYHMDESKIIARVSAPVMKMDEEAEAFTITFVDQENGSVALLFAWDHTKVELPIKFK
ncbi:MAG TPA: DUF2911 domain-containing protein [Saprospiraceae bacterium]|nr:DUF2911 domain-containing protein [Saprospiraceae bacterium]MCB9269881.1 DUF2911 domain-containing protein [Lewinellaceae bacterium]HPG07215.1 DUF2911 domain-containing protein [Saprospiraceae bacterium]HPR00126.1 DUF2911 domain-containing protein [Saprospiraceae bacterium]HQU55511.1 DUF2911 domain-containing protein [Saprospiraceae bacterium]